MNYKSMTDEMLLLYLRTGDKDAFREIYLRYWKKLLAMARRKVDSQDTVEELLQDIFLKLWERRNSLRIERLDAYLFTTVRYTAINHIKSTMIHEKYTEYAYAHRPVASSVIEEQMELNELKAVVEKQLNDLPEKNAKSLSRIALNINRLSKFLRI